MADTRGDILVVDADLMALARLRDAAARAGKDVQTTTGAGVGERLSSGSIEMIVLDLDQGGHELVDAVATLREKGIQLPRVIAFYSHIDEQLGAAADSAGFETYPRGRFWRTLDDLLTAST